MTKKKACGTGMSEEQHRDFKKISYARGLTMEQAHEQAISAWLGEPDEQRDRQMEEFSRFQKMLADAEKDPTSTAGSIVQLFRDRYGGTIAGTSSKSLTKRKR